VLSVSFGAPYVCVVALNQIASDLGGGRSIPALAGSLAWFGSAVGGVLMGRVAERIGVRWTVIFGAVMIAAGLVVSSGGSEWQLYLGHGVLIGLLGNAGMNAPLYVYISRWFDRRRGTALALISSGPHVAGAVWPPVIGLLVGELGWRHTMVIFAVLQVALIVPLAALLHRPHHAEHRATGAGAELRRIAATPRVVMVALCVAAVLCCIPMAMPPAHLIAYCGDLGIGSNRGTLMLSILLACAFISRQVWGWVSDRIGGLETVLICSVLQVASFTGLAITQDEVGLFFVAAAFGLGFSGIIPAYALAVRELFPASEAGWRIPTVLMCTGSGMAIGGWGAGALYDHFGIYAPAFAVGIFLNVCNVLIVAALVALQHWRPAKTRLRASLKSLSSTTAGVRYRRTP
jgi:MFS family permease